MKVIPIGLASEYASRTSTLAYFLKLTRADGLTFGWTSVDIALVYAGVRYEPGLTATTIALASGLAVNNFDLTILPDEEGGTITRADLLTGLWDNGRFEFFEANYSDLSDGINTLLVGVTGQVSLGQGEFQTEMRGITQFLQHPIGIVTSKTCRALLGDSDCTVDLSGSSGFTVGGTLTAVTSRQVVVDSSRTEADDWFAEGTFIPTSGANLGQNPRRIRVYAFGTFTFDLPFQYPFVVGDTYTAIVGCRKRLEDCRDKFDNVLNFQGEPHGRGIDVITSTPVADV